MINTAQQLLNCPNCGTQFPARIEQIIDLRQNPDAKFRLLSGQFNVVECPQCHNGIQVAAPLAYHDPEKELLLVHVPMELNINRDEQEKIIGQFTRSISDSLAPEQRKGYLLNPRSTMTIQGMIDTVLEADGITKEMIAARQRKVELVEQLMMTPPDRLEKKVAELDEQLDEDFFTMITATAEAAIANGRQDVAQQVLGLRSMLMEYSSYGQELLADAERQEAVIADVTNDLNKLGEEITHETLLDLASSYGESDDYLQAFVGLIRPVLDYAFFQHLTDQIENANSEKTQLALTGLRSRLLELVDEIDEQRKAILEQASEILGDIVGSEDINLAVRENLPFINDVFLSVLEANLQAAEERDDQELFQRFQAVNHAIRELIREGTPPEIQFINDLLQAEDDMEARLLLVDHAAEYGEALLDTIDALIDDLQSRGNVPIIKRLEELREEAEKVILAP